MSESIEFQPRQITVLVVDDHQVVRAGLSALLSLESGIKVVGETSEGSEAIALARRIRPDVALMDVRMPGISGVEATRQIIADASTDPVGPTRVLNLSTYDDEDIVCQCLRAGASGFIVKEAAPENLIEAIRAIARGDAWLDPSVAGKVIDALRATKPVGVSPSAMESLLTPRERAVLVLMATGLSNQQISEEWVISEATVKTHVNRILAKTGARDRAAAVVMAYQNGLVRVNGP